MEAEKKIHFHTRVIHAALTPGEWQGATLPPIFQTAAHCHETAENLSDTFAGRTSDHIYARLSNPTNRVLEQKMAALEGGRSAVFMSSGMAAAVSQGLRLISQKPSVLPQAR